MDLLFDFYRTARFATRLPLPLLKREQEDTRVDADGFARTFPLVGLVVGGMACVLGVALLGLGMPSTLVSFATILVLILLTGALHEDGLADFCDGVGGGRTRERKLAIMRDSSIGTYGVLSLVVTLGAKASALAALGDAGTLLFVSALIVTQMVSRSLTMMVAAALPLAQGDGASASLGRPTRAAALTGLIAGVMIAAIPTVGIASVQVGWLIGVGWIAVIVLAMMVASVLVAHIAQRYLGGQTGDVLGAHQQLTDLAGLAVATTYVVALF